MNPAIENFIKTLTEVADQLISGLAKIAAIDSVNGPSLAASTASDYARALDDLAERLKGKPGTATPGKAISRAQMGAMTPAALSDHFRAGGRVIN